MRERIPYIPMVFGTHRQGHIAELSITSRNTRGTKFVIDGNALQSIERNATAIHDLEAAQSINFYLRHISRSFSTNSDSHCTPRTSE